MIKTQNYMQRSLTQYAGSSEVCVYVPNHKNPVLLQESGDSTDFSLGSKLQKLNGINHGGNWILARTDNSKPLEVLLVVNDSEIVPAGDFTIKMATKYKTPFPNKLLDAYNT